MHYVSSSFHLHHHHFNSIIIISPPSSSFHLHHHHFTSIVIISPPSSSFHLHHHHFFFFNYFIFLPYHFQFSFNHGFLSFVLLYHLISILSFHFIILHLF